MCGIIGLFCIQKEAAQHRNMVLSMSKKIRHRGPDWSGVYSNERVILAHERLAIVDPLSGKQPLYSPDNQKVLAVNGEIYNHRDLRKWFPEYGF